MRDQTKPNSGDVLLIPPLPRWVMSSKGQTLETVIFSSGAALALLDAVMRDPGGMLPAALMRDRLAMEAAEACLKLEGRQDSRSQMRDAICLARAGEALGPAGEMFDKWRRVARLNLRLSASRENVATLLPGPIAQSIEVWTAFAGSPVAKAAQVVAETLRQFPRQETAALMLADVTLARAVGWDRPVPLLAAHMKRADLRAFAEGADDLDLSVHRAVVAGSDMAIRQASDLSRRMERLQAVAPKLRAKSADAALRVFLSHDAVSPSGMLSPIVQGTNVAMTDRAARRLCDRLVELGVVRELTGRATFRLYGV